MTLLDHVLYINLESRTDRLAHVNGELNKLGIQGERMNAIKLSNGALGCSLSHIRCLEIAKARELPHIFICEDDITFLHPTLLLENVEKFEKSGIEWDVLIIGGNNAPPYDTVSDFCIRAKNTQTTTGYIVRNHYYDTLLANFKAGAFRLMKEPHNKKHYAVDMYWKSLQRTDRWYMIIPLTVVQYDDFSDIEERPVNYTDLMLDVRKDWLKSAKPSMKMNL
jgi:GR25 family glycosyltransferase involved in LPS biosynthesis